MLALWSTHGGEPAPGPGATVRHGGGEVDRAALRLPHLPALDGLRGLSLVAVLLFHGGLGWATGGFLGVTAFFTLSGFLITSLLLLERSREGRIDLRAFWGRRARRLVPAALICLVLAAAYAALLPEPPSGLVGDAAAAAAWVANWRAIFKGQSYGDLFSAPSPLQHLWSLAVEEQVYLALPIVVVALLGRGDRVRTGRLAAAVLGLIVASSAAMALLHEPGTTSSRAYYGTDARAAEPLLGALLACVLVGGGGLRQLRRGATRALDAAAVVALLALGALVATAGQADDALYRGGFLLTAGLAAVVLAAATQPGTLVAKALSIQPLRWLGTLSYGAYLYHWPIFLYLDEDRTGLEGLPLLAARMAVVLPLAVASHALVEQPIRRGALRGRIPVVAWANGTVGAIAVVAAVLVVPAASPAVLTTQGGSEVASVATTPTTASLAGAVTPTTGSTAAPKRGAGPSTTKPAAAGPRPTQLVSATPTTKKAAAKKKGPPPGFSPPRSDPAQPPPVVERNLRVAVVGDSMAYFMAEGLQAWAKEVGGVTVYNAAIGGCPLALGGTRRHDDGTPAPVAEHCGWWDDPSSERYQLFQRFDPQVIITEDGLNESMDRKLDRWRSFRKTGDPEFDVWLLEELRRFIAQTAEPEMPVIVMNAPCADMGRYEHWYDAEEQTRRAKSMNTRTYQLLATDSRVTVADFLARLCPNDGAYQDEVEGVADGRPDGVHPSAEASLRLARSWLGPMVLEAAKDVPRTAPSSSGPPATAPYPG